MSSTTFSTQSPSPIVIRRPPISDDAVDEGYKRPPKRRSLSDRLRNLFRKSSSSPNRSTSEDPRKTPSSPRLTSSSNEAPHLRTPNFNWGAGKKKTKSSPTSVKNKSKQTTKPQLEISSPIYSPENQTLIHGQNFVPRTPEFRYDDLQRISSSSNYDTATITTKGFRDHTTYDRPQTPQQVVVPDVDVITPLPYTSDHDISPYINIRRSPNIDIDYRNKHNSTLSGASIPLTDIEVHSTPRNVRRTDGNLLLSNNPVVIEKSPIYSTTSLGPSSTTQPINIVTNSNEWKSSSSSALNTAGARQSAISTMDSDSPKLKAPSIPFGSISSKKNSKGSKSKTRTNGLTSSTSTINNLVSQNPLNVSQSWTTTYGSLPDAEMVYDDRITSKPPLPKANKYPGLSAIVQHHVLLPPTRYNEYIPRTTTTTTTTTSAATTTTATSTTVKHPTRFDTSTTTLDEHDRTRPWPDSTIKEIVPSTTTTTTTTQCHDGYIRPMSPSPTAVQVGINIYRLDPGDGRDHSYTYSPRPTRYEPPETRPTRYESPETRPTRYESPETRPTRYESPETRPTRYESPETRPTRYESPETRPTRYEICETPPMYRSSTTVYTRDKHQYVDGGEIVTWSARENPVTDNRNDPYMPPYIQIQVNHIPDQQTDCYDRQIIPTKPKDDVYEYRYSPRANEGYYTKPVKFEDDNDQQIQEERYEISYEYERNSPKKSYDTIKHDNKFHSVHQYSNAVEKEKRLLSSTILPERDPAYDQSTRSFIQTGNTQEHFVPRSPVANSQPAPRIVRLKRRNSFDGLGILISADSATRLNHYVREVEPNSPGHRAGLRKNDRLICVNDTNVENVDFGDVLTLIRQGLDHDNLQLTVIHEPEYN